MPKVKETTLARRIYGYDVGIVKFEDGVAVLSHVKPTWGGHHLVPRGPSAIYINNKLYNIDELPWNDIKDYLNLISPSNVWAKYDFVPAKEGDRGMAAKYVIKFFRAAKEEFERTIAAIFN
jgi:hypothetical protein